MKTLISEQACLRICINVCVKCKCQPSNTNNATHITGDKHN